MSRASRRSSSATRRRWRSNARPSPPCPDAVAGLVDLGRVTSEEGRLSKFELGIVIPIVQYGKERTTPRWPEIRAMAVRAEAIGFATIWTPDELLWRAKEGPPRGVWDGVAMAGAVAATTSTA